MRSVARRSMTTIYDDLWNVDGIEQWLASEERLQPRSPSSLFDLVADIGLNETTPILDAGCGLGIYAGEMVKRFGSRVVALDPVESNIASARAVAAENNFGERMAVHKGEIESLPFADGHFALVWCRSVIVHLPALLPAFLECKRVLRPGGHLMLQTGYATPEMTGLESETLCRRLGFYPQMLQQQVVESAIHETDFQILRSESYRSEYAEFYELRDGRCAKHLMGMAKLLRGEELVVERFGRNLYETALGMYAWQIYQMMGKISYHAYLLRKPG
jgi:SAM-dependent methyltransferase